MNCKSFFLIVILFFTATFLFLIESSSNYTNLAEKINNYLKRYPDLNGALLITQEGKIIFRKCYGYANFESEIPNSLVTKFRIASLTKSFTAMAIMLLQERGLLDVQDSLCRHIPDWPNDTAITVHHLLTHTSGIPNYYSRFTELRECNSLQKLISIIQTWPLEFQPGSNYQYSNSGYIMLAYIIEKVSGVPYQIFLQKNIFEPLKMTNTGHETQNLILQNRASGYIKEQQEVKNAPLTDSPITLIGNGDLYSCLEDLYLWDQALYSEKLVSNKTLDYMFKPHVILSSDRAHGYGWFVGKRYLNECVEYSGALRGFLSKHMRFLADKISIIILSNVEDQNQFCKICDDIPAIIYEQQNNE